MVSSHYLAKNSHLLLVLDFLLSPPSHNYDSTYYVQTLECICLILLTVSTVLKWAHPLTDEKSTERIRNTYRHSRQPTATICTYPQFCAYPHHLKALSVLVCVAGPSLIGNL